MVPQFASVAFQPLDPNSGRLTVTPTPGNSLIAANDLALLRFVVRPQTNSAVVPIDVSDIQITPAGAGLTPTLLATDGKLMIVGSAPFLDARINSAGQREVTLYAQPGNYTVQFSTNLADPQGWRLRGFVRVTNNLERTISGAGTPTNIPVFFRVRQ